MDSITATQMIGGNGERLRSKSDYYPTPPEVTTALINHLNLPLETLIWEPACGDGEIVKTLEMCGYDHVIATDIRETQYYPYGVDFLKTVPHDNFQVEFIITNPPFSKSEAFIRHAWDFSVPFAFLLKSQYWHAARRLPLFNDCPPSYVMPLTWRPDFLFKSNVKHGASLMDVMWCVWEPFGGYDRKTIYFPLRRPKEEK